MSAVAEKYAAELKALPIAERAYLAHELWSSLPAETEAIGEVTPDDSELSPEWKAELERREQASEAGLVRYLTQEEVTAQIRERLNETHPRPA